MRNFHFKSNKTVQPLDTRSIELRKTIIQMVKIARRGHLASAFSLVEILRVLYDDILCYNPKDPSWSKRDRCILSKGHGCLSLYALLAEKGFFPESELWKFCHKDGLLGGHPEHKTPGVEASTGSLGHGFSIGVGFALNEKYEKTGYRTFIILGDGECNEGSIWEAAFSTSKHKLKNLTVIIDYNKLQSYGPTKEVQELEPFSEKWQSFGFEVHEVDGHSVNNLKDVFLKLPFSSTKPSAVICHTIKGKGIAFMESNLEWHHKSKIDDDEIQSLLYSLESN